MSLQFSLPLVSFICVAPSCASCALLEFQACTKVFRAGTISVWGTCCTCIFLKPSLKCTYSDTHTGSTFSGLTNSLLFYNTKLVCSSKKDVEKKISFFIESCKTAKYLFKRQELFPRVIPVAFRALSFYLCGSILIVVPFFLLLNIMQGDL